MDLSEQYSQRDRNQMSRIELSFNDRLGSRTVIQKQQTNPADLSNEDFTAMQQRMAMIRDAYEDKSREGEEDESDLEREYIA